MNGNKKGSQRKRKVKCMIWASIACKASCGGKALKRVKVGRCSIFRIEVSSATPYNMVSSTMVLVTIAFVPL